MTSMVPAFPNEWTIVPGSEVLVLMKYWSVRDTDLLFTIVVCKSGEKLVVLTPDSQLLEVCVPSLLYQLHGLPVGLPVVCDVWRRP